MSHARSILTLTLLGAFAVVGRPAHAESASTCVAAFEAGQDLEAHAHLVAARARYVTCAQDTCHPLVRRDCAERLEGLSRSTPSLVFAARDASGSDVADARVWLDGAEIPRARLAIATPVDPGEHVVRFEHPALLNREERVLVRVGETQRRIVGVLAARPRGAPAVETPRASRSAISPSVLALGGLSVAALGGFGYFAASGYSEKQSLLSSCAPGCGDDRVASVRTRYLAADVLLAAGLVAGGLAAFIHFGGGGRERAEHP